MIQIRSFLGLLVTHIRVQWFAYVLCAVCLFMFQANYRVGINQTDSLPQSLFLIQLNASVHKGDYLAFHPKQGTPFKHDAILTKIVVGTEGDVVTVKDRLVFVNDRAVGLAKPKSLKGEPLDPINPVTIGRGQYYVMGLHKDSLDSRYSMLSLIDRSHFVGRAHPIW